VGCTCGHHPQGNLPAAEKDRLQRERAHERYVENREEKIAYAQEWGRSHPERRRANTRRAARVYREKNRDTINAKARAAYDPAADSVKSRVWKFGLSREETVRRFNEQRGRCYMGGEPLDLDAPRGFFVDHARWCCPGIKSCGQCVRGLTCDSCNKGAGCFGDDPARLRRAADAIEAADAAVSAQMATMPVQGELPIDIKRAARRREESA
jgi:hypothetical protein